MFNKIDKIVDEIVKTDQFQIYKKNCENLTCADVLMLLSKHSMIQDDYFKSKQYSQYIDNTELYEKYKEVKNELLSNEVIQEYYKSYYEINELLEEVTTLLFANISDEVLLESVSLGSKL